jgi:hypothetical protein
VLHALGLMSIGRGDSAGLQKILAGQEESNHRCSFVQPGHFQVSLRIARHHVNPFCPAGGQLRRMSSSVERDILDVRFIRWPAIEVLIAHPPAPELLRHLSTMTTSELLQSDLTGRAKFVGANDRLPTDERAEIDTREVLSASWTHRRVRDVARRMHDGTEPLVARQSPNLGTAERWT